ncbi:helix-turn-helix domain-containing protein [Altererythrobacter xixiisoli]|uniref:Helix-turn-helix domain-containing protein n=1 Tax=Croceibacterium xixiisoli TaxID=1476466 RepID=A0A6I4TX57_9SPHN|nr:helix-turn-helix domain-containing protein [Croceibacterium xixiisoli]MXP00483.1 helix-turn-helix domain-containing protein [Croceibacterium xixiisoli]
MNAPSPAASFTVSRDRSATWRKSYDVDDPRAQVSAIHWEPSAKNENALKFFDVFTRTVVRYSDHIREAGKQLPISMNARAVLEALFSVMDGKSGRCDPCLDTIAKRSRLSRRTVVRQLEALRRQKIVDWVRRTVKTGNAKGEGPQRQQTSNSYFIDLAGLPIEILRTLRQKLGDKLRETARRMTGSGAVPNRMAIKAERLLKGVTGALSAKGSANQVNRRALAGASAAARIEHMYGGDVEAMRQHMAMLEGSDGQSASARLALYPLLRTKG